MKIRLVTFDALFTILRPRKPIHVQYADAFAPFFGQLPPDAVKSAFKTALKELQSSRPAYAQGPESWWEVVIARTALGAGAREADVKEHLSTIVHQLLRRFSSKEGYALYDDALPTLNTLHAMGIATALVTNADSRILQALDDLGALRLFNPVLASDLEGVEKPEKEIFLRACQRAGVQPEETLHVGDEMECDYHGSTQAGLHALLLCRSPEDQFGGPVEVETHDGVTPIGGLNDVVPFLKDNV